MVRELWNVQVSVTATLDATRANARESVSRGIGEPRSMLAPGYDRADHPRRYAEGCVQQGTGRAWMNDGTGRA